MTNGVLDSDEPAQLGACAIKKGDSYAVLGTNLITVDSVAPGLASGSAVSTGVAYNTTTKKELTGLSAKANSMKIAFGDTGKVNDNAPGSGLDPNSVSPGAFTVAGNTVEAVLVVGNDVYLTLGEDLGSSEKPRVSIANGHITDRAGNAYSGTSVTAVDKLGPNLSLSKSASLSNEKVTITITTDEQLNAFPTVWVTKAAKDGTAEPDTDAAGVGGVRQSGALSYTYAKADSDGGEFSVYVQGKDTGEIANDVGDDGTSASAGAFTFELDKKLNKGAPPVVAVSDNEDVANDPDSVEQVEPMIVTVDFSAEGAEYDRDSYRTVELTSAVLKVSFADGTSTTKTFNLTTEVSSPDNIKFTIPLLNPRIGTYALTVKAVDQAGNNRLDGAGTAQSLTESWSVVAPKPVDIGLAPGWNLISLPFQPANPAVNSVIPADHPADIVMTFDNFNQVWLVSRRDSETGLFRGDITILTANTAYFIRTNNFQVLRMLRPPLATGSAPPPPPPALEVVKGWNLVPIVSLDIPTPKGIAADDYFGDLSGGTSAGLVEGLDLQHLDPDVDSVAPGDTMVLGPGDKNPCTGEDVNPAAVVKGNEPCQIGQYEERSTSLGDIREGDTIPDPANV